MTKNFLDKAVGYDMIKLIEPVELVPAVWAISICWGCRKTLPVARPGAPLPG